MIAIYVLMGLFTACITFLDVHEPDDEDAKVELDVFMSFLAVLVWPFVLPFMLLWILVSTLTRRIRMSL